MTETTIRRTHNLLIFFLLITTSASTQPQHGMSEMDGSSIHHAALYSAGCAEQIKTFYKAYMEDVLHNGSINDTLCKTYLTEELQEKVTRLIYATGGEPIIRAQDMNLDAIETLNVKALGDDWYLVSYRWGKEENSDLTEIPIKAKNRDGVCKIIYNTPPWNGTEYGDQQLKEKQTVQINQASALAFLESFYKAYTYEYCSMPKNLSGKLASLREQYLSKDAIAQYKNAEEESKMDGYSGYDLVIDNFDFDTLWAQNLNFNAMGNNDFLVSYQNGITHNLVVSLIKETGNYKIHSIKVLG